MKRVLRRGDNVNPVIDCSIEPDMARQEFKKDADINVLVNRMLAGQPVPLAPRHYAAVDYTADLDSQYAAAQDLRAQHHELVTDGGLQLSFLEYIEKLAAGESLTPEKEPDPAKTAEETAPETPPKASA